MELCPDCPMNNTEISKGDHTSNDARVAALVHILNSNMGSDEAPALSFGADCEKPVDGQCPAYNEALKGLFTK